MTNITLHTADPKEVTYMKLTIATFFYLITLFQGIAIITNRGNLFKRKKIGFK